MDYREKAVRCVRETVLPVQAAQFRACGCDLDAQYRKYGDTESFFAKVLQPGTDFTAGEKRRQARRIIKIFPLPPPVHGAVL